MNVYERLTLAARILDTIPTGRPEELPVETRAAVAAAHAQLAEAQLAATRAYGGGWLLAHADRACDEVADIKSWCGA